MDPTKIETTYAELRDGDVLIDKSGGRWHVSGVETWHPEKIELSFWLGDVRTKVRLHHMTKPAGDAVTVERIPTHADDVATLENDFPASGRSSEAGSTLPDPSMRLAAGEAMAPSSDPRSTVSSMSEATTPDRKPLPGVASLEEDARRAALIAQTFGHDPVDIHVTTSVTHSEQDGVFSATTERHEQAVNLVTGELLATVDVDLTAEQIDEARQATEDEPVEVALFESMTDLEQRSHLFVLHGIFSEDIEDRKTRAETHVAAHREKVAGRLRSLSRPHIHTEKVTA